MALLATFCLIIFIQTTQALLGYDCGAKTLNMTTISLLDIGNCDIPKINVTTENVNVQLLQLVDYNQVKVLQCKIIVDRTVYSCSWWSYLIPVTNGRQQYMYEISRDQCAKMHETGFLKFGGSHVITGIKVNNTILRGIDLVGKGDNCAGGSFSDDFGSYTDVYVQAVITINLTEQTAIVNLDNDKLHLKSEVVCKYSISNCIDNEEGYSFWNLLPSDTCNYNHYGILF